MRTSELKMRGRREPAARHARHYEERLHDFWKVQDRLREETDRRYADRHARKEEEPARSKMRADAERRYRINELQRSGGQRIRAQDECRRETQRNRDLLNQLKLLLFSPHQRSNFQVNPFFIQTANVYSHNRTPSLVTRTHLVHQPRLPELRQVPMDDSRDATSMGLAEINAES